MTLCRFRLAQLYLEAFRRLKVTNIDEASKDRVFGTASSGLHDFYRRILESAEQDIRDDLFVMLKWTSLAVRPMFVEELLDACATLSTADCLFDRGGRRHFEIFDQLIGLVTVLPDLPSEPDADDSLPRQTHRAFISHFSVQEYLWHIQPLGWNPNDLRFSSLLAQRFCAKSCLAYLLSYTETDWGDVLQYQASFHPSLDNYSTPALFPFLNYARHFWARHAAADSLKLANETPVTPLSLALVNVVIAPNLYPRQERKRYEEVISKLFDTFSTEDVISLRHSVLVQPGTGVNKRHREKHHREIEFQLAPAVDQRDTVLHSSGILPEAVAQTSDSKAVYSSLQNSPDLFRLLAIQPADDYDSPMICTLLINSFENKPLYEVLSSSWKISDDHAGIDGIEGVEGDDSIEVNGGRNVMLLEGTKFCLTENLMKVLRGLRNTSKPRIVWIVLCINMYDDGGNDFVVERGGDKYVSTVLLNDIVLRKKKRDLETPSWLRWLRFKHFQNEGLDRHQKQMQRSEDVLHIARVQCNHFDSELPHDACAPLMLSIRLLLQELSASYVEPSLGSDSRFLFPHAGSPSVQPIRKHMLRHGSGWCVHQYKSLVQKVSCTTLFYLANVKRRSQP